MGERVKCPPIKREPPSLQRKRASQGQLKSNRNEPKQSTRAVSISGHPTLGRAESPLTSIPSMAATLLYSSHPPPAMAFIHARP